MFGNNGLVWSFKTDAEAHEWGVVYGILTVIWILDTWELYLLFRQWGVVNNTTTVPNLLTGILPVESFSRARLFTLDALMYLMMKTFLDVIAHTVIILFDVLSLLWIWSLGISGALIQPSSEILTSIFFVAIAYTVMTLGTLPSKMYVKFVILSRYGINKETLSSFLIGTLKIYLAETLGLSLLTLGLVLIFQFARMLFLFYIWLLQIVFVLLYLTIFMNIFFPMTGSFKPLEDGELKESIKNLASRVDFPVAQIMVYKASATSTTGNAYFYGFCGGKRIVLYDTIIAFLSVQEIVAVLAHELGHWKGNHILKILILEEIYLTCLFAGAHILLPLDVIYRAFNFHDSKPIIIGLVIIFNYIFILFDYVVKFLMVFIKRYYEYEADAFAVKLNQGKYLSSALIKLYRNNLSFPVDDWLYSKFAYDHPTLMERLQKLPRW